MNHLVPDENSIAFWKQKYEELNIQFDEFQRSSRDFEQELESELKQCEDEIKDLKNRNNRLSMDNDNLKSKLNEMTSTTHKQISKLQEELAKLKAVKDEMQKYIRELEQKNDDLERTNRCAMFSLGEFESKLNEALERNAILESELDEKDELAETVQRLRDEARDLKQELAVRQLKAQKDINKSSNTSSLSNNDNNNNSNININLNNSSSCPMETETSISSSSSSTTTNQTNEQLTTENEILKNSNDAVASINQDDQQQHQAKQNAKSNNNKTQHYNHHSHHQNNPVTPSLRISALNFVGDALRKVTSMESRLVATRNLMKESNRDRRSATISSIESSRIGAQEKNEDNFQHLRSPSRLPTTSKIPKTDTLD